MSEGIKIIEFNREDNRSPIVPAGREKSMKIIEFDNDARDNGRAVATARDIGHIKILEFDDNQPANQPLIHQVQRAVIKPIKIRDFGVETDTNPQNVTGSEAKIKIMEFD